MKKIITLLLLFPALSIYSQVYVSPNYYMYVKNEVLFVNQDINLQVNANIYLRNESQLLQGATVTSTNTGGGKLSLYQEGTSDNYEYNFWCSPVGNASSSTGNENFGITMLGRPVSTTASTPAIALTNDSDGYANPLSISTYWIYKYLSSPGSSGWIAAANTTTIGAGEGFTMKGTAGTDTNDVEGNGIQNNPGGQGAQRYDFSGKPNNGNITVTLDAGKFTLTGNPYPSALNVNIFLLDGANTASTGVAYYWEQDKNLNTHNIGQYRGGYGTYSPISLFSSGIYVPATFNTYNPDGSMNTGGASSGQAIERKYAPVGQGFMIQGNTSGTVTLKNSYRTYYKEAGALSQFERTPISTPDSLALQPVSYFKMNAMLNNGFSRQIALALIPEATDSIDRGIDGPLPDADLPDDIYFVLEGGKYVIQGIPFDVNKRIDIGVKSSTSASIQFYIPEILNFDPNQPIYIYDDLDGSYHDIRTQSYEAVVSEGIFNDRFQITFTTGTLSVPSEMIGTIIIVQDNKQQLLHISNPKLYDIETVNLYDISGRLVFNMPDPTAEETISFSTNGLSDGVYIVQVMSSDHTVKTEKIIIFN